MDGGGWFGRPVELLSQSNVFSFFHIGSAPAPPPTVDMDPAEDDLMSAALMEIDPGEIMYTHSHAILKNKIKNRTMISFV